MSGYWATSGYNHRQAGSVAPAVAPCVRPLRVAGGRSRSRPVLGCAPLSRFGLRLSVPFVFARSLSVDRFASLLGLRYSLRATAACNQLGTLSSATCSAPLRSRPLRSSLRSARTRRLGCRSSL